MSTVKQATLNQHVNAEAVGAYADRLGEWQTGDYHADSALATAAGKIRDALAAAMAAERQASDVLYDRIYNRETSAASETEGCTCCQTRSLAGQADDECARCGHLGKFHVTCNKPLRNSAAPQ